MSEDPIIAIVPAAGIGARARRSTDADIPKQYRLLNGQAMLRRAVESLLVDTRISEVRVAVSIGDAWTADALADVPRTVIRHCGGATRALTVANALADAGVDPATWVLVHDAARPGLPADALARLIDACIATNRCGLLALPVADTVKRSEAACAPAVVAQTIARDGLWLAQTPQMARQHVLLAALERAAQAGLSVTDEAQALEYVGQPPLLVRGSVRNFKVTWPEDFELMEKWL